MKTYTIQTEIGGDKKLRLEIPCDLPEGPVEVVVVVQANGRQEKHAAPRWADLEGLGKEIWQGIDPLEYVRELRADKDLHL